MTLLLLEPTVESWPDSRGCPVDIQVPANRYAMLDSLLVWAVAIVVLSILAARAARAMNRRAAPGWLFGLLVAFVSPIGLLVWAIASTVMPVAPRVGSR